jgi:hypothetical protein
MRDCTKPKTPNSETGTEEYWDCFVVSLLAMTVDVRCLYSSVIISIYDKIVGMGLEPIHSGTQAIPSQTIVLGISLILFASGSQEKFL